MFVYCKNNPVNASDPTGFDSSTDEDGNGIPDYLEERWRALTKKIKSIGNLFSTALFLSNSFNVMSAKTFFFGYETGADDSDLIAGSADAPIVLYAEMGHSWWQYDEFALGISFNDDDSGFGIAVT